MKTIDIDDKLYAKLSLYLEDNLQKGVSEVLSSFVISVEDKLSGAFRDRDLSEEEALRVFEFEFLSKLIDYKLPKKRLARMLNLGLQEVYKAVYHFVSGDRIQRACLRLEKRCIIASDAFEMLLDDAR